MSHVSRPLVKENEDSRYEGVHESCKGGGGLVKNCLGECSLKVTRPDGECSKILVSNAVLLPCQTQFINYKYILFLFWNSY